MGREEIPPPEIILYMPMSQSLIEYSRRGKVEWKKDKQPDTCDFTQK